MGGLSTPIKVERGISHGSPLSGLLYFISIEPLLCLLRRRLVGLKANFLEKPIKLSAYADDTTVVECDNTDVFGGF